MILITNNTFYVAGFMVGIVGFMVNIAGFMVNVVGFMVGCCWFHGRTANYPH
jgi:hypothetical protein